MTIKLGQTPDRLEVTLVKGSDFVDGIDKTDGTDWPTGLEVKIVFNDRAKTTFQGAVSGPQISWSVPSDQVDALIARRPTWAILYYKDGDLDLPWGVGAPTILLEPPR